MKTEEKDRSDCAKLNQEILQTLNQRLIVIGYSLPLVGLFITILFSTKFNEVPDVNLLIYYLLISVLIQVFLSLILRYIYLLTQKSAELVGYLRAFKLTNYENRLEKFRELNDYKSYYIVQRYIFRILFAIAISLPYISILIRQPLFYCEIIGDALPISFILGHSLFSIVICCYIFDDAKWTGGVNYIAKATRLWESIKEKEVKK